MLKEEIGLDLFHGTLPPYNTRDAIYLNSNVITVHELLAGGAFSYITIAGLMLYSADRLVSLAGTYATI